jgi:hypothetical protein
MLRSIQILLFVVLIGSCIAGCTAAIPVATPNCCTNCHGRTSNLNSKPGSYITIRRLRAQSEGE